MSLVLNIYDFLVQSAAKLRILYPDNKLDISVVISYTIWNKDIVIFVLLQQYTIANAIIRISGKH